MYLTKAGGTPLETQSFSPPFNQRESQVRYGTLAVELELSQDFFQKTTLSRLESNRLVRELLQVLDEALYVFKPRLNKWRYPNLQLTISACLMCWSTSIIEREP